MPRTGRHPTAGLEPRACASCGNRFQPYRAHQIACSRSCRHQVKDQSPRRKLYDLVCKSCGAEFQSEWTGLGRQPSCADCTVEKRRANQERKNLARRVDVNPARSEANRRIALKTLYGLAHETYLAMLAEQDGKCAICGFTPAPGGKKAAARLHVDHDHDTGRVRALLCNGCNRGLGYLQDNPALLRAAADYIEQHKE